MTNHSTTALPIGEQASLLGHFNVPVILESPRRLLMDYDRCLSFLDGASDEAIIADQEASVAADASLAPGAVRFCDPPNRERRFIPLRFDDARIKGSQAQFLCIH